MWPCGGFWVILNRECRKINTFEAFNDVIV
jgi:hypothetical protein